MTGGFLLDTNVASEQTKARPHPGLGSWLDSQPDDSLFLSAITIGELRQGIVLAPQGKRRNEIERWFETILVPQFSGRVLPITAAVAEQWGLISAARRLAGKPLETSDGLIAATALQHDLTVVTRNVRDFSGLNLVILNPWDV